MSITVVAAGFAGHKETLAEQTDAAAACLPAMIATPAVTPPARTWNRRLRVRRRTSPLAGFRFRPVQEAPRAVPSTDCSPKPLQLS